MTARFRIAALAALFCVGATPRSGSAADAWPQLRLARTVAVQPVTRDTIAFGGSGALGDGDGRMQIGADGGIGYAAAISRVTLQGALFALQGVRGARDVQAIGHGRVAAVAVAGAWEAGAGVDLWLGDGGLDAWLDAPSPWAAAAWRRRLWGAGASLTWDRSAQAGPYAAVARWVEDARDGLRPAVSVFGDWRGFAATMAYGVALDERNGTLRSDRLTVDAGFRRHGPLAVVVPGIACETAVAQGYSSYPFTVMATLRVEFAAGALWDELFAAPEADTEAAPAFSPFDP